MSVTSVESHPKIRKLQREIAELREQDRRREEEWRVQFERALLERQDLVTRHSGALIEVETRNADKFEELRSQLRAFREKTQAAIAEKDAEIQRIRGQLQSQSQSPPKEFRRSISSGSPATSLSSSPPSTPGVLSSKIIDKAMALSSPSPAMPKADSQILHFAQVCSLRS